MQGGLVALVTHVGGLTPPWLDDAGRLLIATTITLGLMVGLTGYILTVPRSDKPTTWAQNMAGAVLVFALFLLAYGVVPSEWIIFANAYLRWDEANVLLETYPITMTKAVARDIVAVGIYVFFLVANVVMFVMWQNRKTAEEKGGDSSDEAASATSATSAYGRPVTKKV